MKYFIKKSLKLLIDYLIALVIFGVFLYPVISLAGEKFSFWLPVYSFIIFLILTLIVYSDFKTLALTEKKPQYNLNPYPYKGLLMGITGFIPIFLISIVYLLLSFNDDTVERLKEIVYKAFLGPVYFIIRWGGETSLSYIGALLALPLIAMLGYMAGYYNFKLKKDKKEKLSKVEKAYELSPWNPSAKNTTVKKKKKKKRRV